MAHSSGVDNEWIVCNTVLLGQNIKFTNMYIEHLSLLTKGRLIALTWRMPSIIKYIFILNPIVFISSIIGDELYVKFIVIAMTLSLSEVWKLMDSSQKEALYQTVG